MLFIYNELVGDSRVTAAIAFSLALFSHILNHVAIRLQSALSELENPRRILIVEDEGKEDEGKVENKG